MVLPARPAAADQVSDLRAQATQISQELIEEQLQIGAYQQQYSVATAKVEADGRNIAAIGRKIGSDENRIKKETDRVRQEAVTSYMEADTGLSSDEMIFSGNVERISLTNEYNAVATGNTETSVDALRLAQRALHAHQAALQQEKNQDQADQRGQADDLNQAEKTQTQMQSVQSEVTGKLAVAIASQAAAQSAAAAAAVVAAQRTAAAAAAASAASTSTSTATAPGTEPGATLPDPALNSFLRCVVQAESGGNYADVSPNGLYMGAFQFSQPTWNTAALAAGLPQLVGVPPNLASKAAQDTVAVALYALDGERPWLGDRCS
jgi:transglycosylase-like protein